MDIANPMRTDPRLSVPKAPRSTNARPVEEAVEPETVEPGSANSDGEGIFLSTLPLYKEFHRKFEQERPGGLHIVICSHQQLDFHCLECGKERHL